MDHSLRQLPGVRNKSDLCPVLGSVRGFQETESVDPYEYLRDMQFEVLQDGVFYRDYLQAKPVCPFAQGQRKD